MRSNYNKYYTEFKDIASDIIENLAWRSLDSDRFWL